MTVSEPSTATHTARSRTRRVPVRSAARRSTRSEDYAAGALPRLAVRSRSPAYRGPEGVGESRTAAAAPCSPCPAACRNPAETTDSSASSGGQFRPGTTSRPAALSASMRSESSGTNRSLMLRGSGCLLRRRPVSSTTATESPPLDGLTSRWRWRPASSQTPPRNLAKARSLFPSTPMNTTRLR